MAKLRVRGKLTNADKTGVALQRTSTELERRSDEAVRNLGDLFPDMLRLIAPAGRTGALARGIKARKSGPRQVDITVHAIAPESGYDYAAVTRFGHRVEYIYPTEGRRALKVRWQKGGTNYFQRVRGFEPKKDWVDDAYPSILAAADEEMRELGRDITVRVFS